MEISGPIEDGRAVLALPGGAYRIEGLNVPELRANAYGAVRLDDGPGFVSYAAQFAPTSGRDRPPRDTDLLVPRYQQAGIERVSSELGLTGLPSPVVIRRLQRFFEEHFRYSLAPDARSDDLPPLAHFLLHSRKGHCEYFATATVLLLRAAGVPSRYATGYAVQEPGADQGLFVVRERHAHAWALAYVNGRWVDVDFTPSVWAAMEEQRAPWWLPAYDLFSAAAFAFSRWQWSGGGERISDHVYLLLLGLPALLVGWRLYHRKRARKTAHSQARQVLRDRPQGSDSDFRRLMPYLEQVAGPRRPGETLHGWLSRLGPGGDNRHLRDALDLHYRYRFDPNGLSGTDRMRLKTLVDDWLAARASGRLDKAHSRVPS